MRHKARTKRSKAPTLASLKKKAWKLLSELVRRNETAGGTEYVAGCISCYTCGEIHHWKSMQAGHAIGGRNGAVLFDEEIIRPQCVRCNIMLRGNYPEFVARLIRDRMNNLHVYGDSRYEPWGKAHEWWEQKLSTSRQIKKWTRSELEEKISGYKERLKVLEYPKCTVCGLGLWCNRPDCGGAMHVNSEKVEGS